MSTGLRRRSSVSRAMVATSARLLELRDDDGELVAAEAGHQALGADRPDQGDGDLLQQRVAGVVAERVVDLLEAVEVHEHHGDDILAGSGGQGGVQTGAEERPVGQTGEGVVQSLVLAVGRLLAQTVEELAAAQHDARVGGQGLEQLKVVGLKRGLVPDPVGDEEHPTGPVLPGHRRDHGVAKASGDHGRGQAGVVVVLRARGFRG